MLVALLSAKGYDTRVAHDAPVALRIALDFRPDVALLDLGLPVMDGYELAARLRESSDLNGMKLIALTGYGQESNRRKSREAGFNHHSSNRSTSLSSNQSCRIRPNRPMIVAQPEEPSVRERRPADRVGTFAVLRSGSTQDRTPLNVRYVRLPSISNTHVST